MNKWKEFKDFINANGEEGATFCRSGFKKALSKNIGLTTIDGYRSILQKAGFFKAAGRGNYRLTRKIPTDITWYECFMLTQRKNLDYLESRNNRRIKKERKNKGLIKLELTQTDIADIETASRWNNKTHCGNQMCCWGPEGSRQV